MDSAYPLYQELLQGIFGGRDDLLSLRPEDIKMIYQVLERTLSSRECGVIQMRFKLGEEGKEKHTYLEVGEKFGVTPERVRQIYMEAIRKLRHPRNSRELRWLFRDMLEADFEKTRSELAEAKKEVNRLKDLERIVKNLQIRTDLEISIEELGLSTRARYCLLSVDIKTLREISLRSERELRGIRNLGETTLEEIKNKLVQHSLRLADPL